MTASPNPDPLLHGMIALALDAGRVILEFYEGGADVTLKPDASPVTSADLAAEAIILAGLEALAPEIPVIAEEAVARGAIPKASRQFFLVDPLDGTKEFISRNGEFTVNIALIEAGQPVAGVVYAPAIGRLFWGEQGKGAAVVVVADPKAAQEPPREGRRIAAQQAAAGAPIKVVASRSHRDGETDRFLASLGDCEIVSAGSSVKFCLVASGEAQLYPRFGRTMEWDTAAGHAVLAAAGGTVVTADGAPLLYGKEASGFANPPFIAAAGHLGEVNRFSTTSP
ncbi:MAG TPA: 3'(2'),5'-bisphosphate nucleotidase CysQ [Aestuariivirgaceae bacterium]|jgi:3'(2'), 5'-bisphosphate nucleotidase|nr:3'(2'),5'-bisphosphate nucleotidase CysQ [Aestuariivirgaceae bacterium]